MSFLDSMTDYIKAVIHASRDLIMHYEPGL